jgi:hypothetical protein
MIEVDARTLRNALVKCAKRACVAERDYLWHERLSDRDRFRADRDRAVRRCERLLAFAVVRRAVSEKGARALAACVYDALAIERRGVKGMSYGSDPDGHWQRVDALTAALDKAWTRDRIKNFFVWRAAWPVRRIGPHSPTDCTREKLGAPDPQPAKPGRRRL